MLLGESKVGVSKDPQIASCARLESISHVLTQAAVIYATRHSLRFVSKGLFSVLHRSCGDGSAPNGHPHFHPWHREMASCICGNMPLLLTALAACTARLESLL